MKVQNNQLLKQVLSICLVVSLLCSMLGICGIPVYAAENTFEEVSLSLNSDQVDDSSIGLYMHNEEYYISIDDLCALTRSSQKTDGESVSVTQGFWMATFDFESQVFYDRFQSVDIAILEVGKGKYAVPALMFLSYYKAMTVIKDNTLYCRMPAYTAWEALNVDYANSLVDIYELYGGEGNVTFSLTLDILMDFIMGENPTTEKYLKSAYYKALDVDMYSYNAVESYVNERNDTLYNDLVAEETQELLESLSEICETGDTTNTITQEAMDLYILFYCSAQTRDFYNLAYNAMEIGDTTSMRHYADQIASVWREGEFQKSLVKNNAKTTEGVFFLLSSAVETAQQVKYVHQANNLVYRVMGQENMEKLSLDVDDNEWYTVANVYRSTATSLQDSFVNILEDLQTVAINDLVSEAAGKIGVDTFLESAASKATGIKGIKSASWKIGLEVGRGAVNLFSWIDSLAEPDSLVDILFTDVGAYEADRLALYLSELQQNVYWVLCHEYDQLCNDWSNVDAYQDYIYAQQLYCRTSIAMYENLIAKNDEFGNDKDYWRSLFQSRIDKLAVSLYQLTTIQDDGVKNCLPLDLSTFKLYDLGSEYTVSLDLHMRNDNFMEYAVITASNGDGKKVWTYETLDYPRTELTSVDEIGQFGNLYIFNASGTITALDIKTGKVRWENDDFAGRSIAFAADDNAIYLCGFYGPDFFAINYQGDTLVCLEQLDQSYFWASEIKLQGSQALVYLRGGTASYDDPMIFTVDLNTYQVTNGTSDSDTIYSSYLESYKATLRQYPEYEEKAWGWKVYTEYTLYDIDKNGVPELIVKCPDSLKYEFYTYNGSNSVLCGELWDSCYGTYARLYHYDNNGIIVHSGGSGSMRVEYTFLYSVVNNKLECVEELVSTENDSSDELYGFINDLTPIDNFYPITNDLYLN